MPRPLADIRRDDNAYYKLPVSIGTFEPLSPPSTFAVEGRNGGFIATWSHVIGAEGYRVAVMTTNDLASPDRGIYTISSGDSLRFLYPIPSVTRYFAVCSFRAGINSAFSPIKSAISNAGAFDDTVTAPSSNDAPTSQTPNEGTTDYGWQDDPLGGVFF